MTAVIKSLKKLLCNPAVFAARTFAMAVKDKISVVFYSAKGKNLPFAEFVFYSAFKILYILFLLMYNRIDNCVIMPHCARSVR